MDKRLRLLIKTLMISQLKVNLSTVPSLLRQRRSRVNRLTMTRKAPMFHYLLRDLVILAFLHMRTKKNAKSNPANL